MYLAAIGVNVATDVKLVVGTHAHDDHIAGLGRVYEACCSAVFICSAALTTEEFLHDVNADEDVATYVRKRIRNEYRFLFEVVKTRLLEKRIKHAVQELTLFMRAQEREVPAASVVAMSPSSESIDRARKELATGLSRAGQRKNDCAPPTQMIWLLRFLCELAIPMSFWVRIYCGGGRRGGQAGWGGFSMSLHLTR